MSSEENPEEILCSLRKEMTSIKEEETLLKQQILSLNEQFQELMISVAEMYPDILNEDFTQKSEASSPEDLIEKKFHNMTTNYKDTLQTVEKKSRWNEWRDGRPRRRYSEGEMEQAEEHSKTESITRNMRNEKARPSSLNISELSEDNLKTYGKTRISTRSHTDSLNSEFSASRRDVTGDNSQAASPGSNDFGLKLIKLDSERRRRIRHRLKESRKKLDVVHLGLF